MSRRYLVVALCLTWCMQLAIAQETAPPPEAPGTDAAVQRLVDLLSEIGDDAAALQRVIDEVTQRLSAAKSAAEANQGKVAEAEASVQASAEAVAESAAAVKQIEASLESARVELKVKEDAAAAAQAAAEAAQQESAKVQEEVALNVRLLDLLEKTKSVEQAESQAPEPEPAQTDEPVAVAAAPEPAAPDPTETPVPNATPASTEAVTFTPEQVALFESRVQPILQDNCFKCHGPDEQKSEMRLDSRTGILTGGKRGAAIVPGDPAASRLVEAIGYQGELKMPPTGQLGSVAISILTEWIRAGAPYEAEVVPAVVETPPPTAEPAPTPEPAPNDTPRKQNFAEAIAAQRASLTASDPEAGKRIAASEAAVHTSSISFNRDIRPILSNHCFECHGPDKMTQKADLRLFEAEGAFGALPTGTIPVVPGDRNASGLFSRISHADADKRMPPTDFDKPLSDEAIALLGRWIDEGAPWEGHWSFIPPKRSEPPAVAAASWPRNDIDRFILARLENEGLAPSPEADRRTLIRRVTFDLTGLPPTLDEVDAFLADTSPDAYEKVVDRLLASPRYGEHMTRYWLDAARYADTNGYHIDNARDMWPWRDWAIRAYNDNMPFDRFTMVQLAGDLLPEPSKDDLIATGFNRNHMINFEGGAIPEEYHTQYIVDRVDTTSTVWLGLTVSCAQCHDHKYDPISQREFYQMFSYFYNVPEQGLDGRTGNSTPTMPVPSADQQKEMDQLRAALGLTEEAMRVPMPEVDAAQAVWESEWAAKLASRWTALEGVNVSNDPGVTFSNLEDHSVLAGGENPAQSTYEVTAVLPVTEVAAIRLEALLDESLPHGGAGRADNANFVLTQFEAELIPPAGGGDPFAVTFASADADFSQKDFPISNAIDGNAETGWAVEGESKRENRTAYFVASEPVRVVPGSQLRVRLKHESAFAGHSIGRFRLSVTDDETMSPARLGPWYVNGPYRAYDGNAAYTTEFGPESGIDLEATYEDGRYKWVEAEPVYPDAQINRLTGKVAATYLYRAIHSSSDRNMTLALGSNDAIKVWLNGIVVHDNNIQRGVDANQDTVPIRLREGQNDLLMKVVNYGNDYAFYFRKADEQAGPFPLDVELLLASSADKRNARQQRTLRNLYRESHSPEWQGLVAKRNELNERFKQVEAQVPTVMVMQEMAEPRAAFVLDRGQYDQPTEPVKPGTPRALPPLPEGAEANRLGLARWLTSPDHPLTARVTVNRYWQKYFGTGIVKTSEDFGAQGEWPTHPELLDWLATEFVDSGWDIKHMQRLMVTSAAYRQSSKSTPELNARDPKNRLVARGPRFRMDAEMIRDNALSVSGLLVEKVGGPSVRPYQPPGIWEEVAYGAEYTAQRFEPGVGDELHRRSMYTFWKRQAPPPNMMLFDAPNRETCTIQRERTNTPLQALALMNDRQFVEASQAMGRRIVAEGGPDAASRMAYAFELVTARRPNEDELRVLMNVFEQQQAEFASKPETAVQYLAVSNQEVPAGPEACELAAWSSIANLILNLDEAVTKG